MFQKNSNISVIAVTDSSFVLRQSVLQFCGSGFVCPLKHQAKEPWEVWNGYKSLLPAAPHKKNHWRRTSIKPHCLFALGKETNHNIIFTCKLQLSIIKGKKFSGFDGNSQPCHADTGWQLCTTNIAVRPQVRSGANLKGSFVPLKEVWSHSVNMT